MKITLITLSLVLATYIVSFAQSEVTKSDTLKSTKSYKNNIKLELLFLATAYKTINISYQKAISKKSSLSLDAQYFFTSGFYYGFRNFAILPSYSYFLSKYKKGKYNRGLYAKVATPVHHESRTNRPNRYIDVFFAAGFGYEWIIGKRLALDLSLIGGRRMIFSARNPNYFGDAKFHTFLQKRIPIGSFFNAYAYPQIMVGYTF